MIRKGVALTALLVALALGIAACGSSSSSSSKDTSSSGGGSGEPFRVFAVEPLSGPYAVFGKTSEKALRAAEQIINSSGGFDGRPMELTIKDDKGEGSLALSELQEEINSGDAIDLVVPGITSTEAVPMLPVLAKEGLLSATAPSDSSLNDPEKYPLNFGVSTTSQTIAGPMLEQLKQEGFGSVGILLTDNDLGHSNAEAYEEIGSKEGLDIAISYVPEEAVDATSEVEQLASHNPEVIVISALGPTIVPMLKAKEKLGLETPVWGDTLTAAQDLPETVGAATAQEITLQAYPWQVEGEQPGPAYSKQSKEAFDNFYPRLQKAGIETVIGPSVYSYDTVALIADAANKAESTEPEAIAEAIENGLDAADDPLFIGQGGWTATNHYPASTAASVIEVSAAKTNEGLFVGSGSN